VSRTNERFFENDSAKRKFTRSRNSYNGARERTDRRSYVCTTYTTLRTDERIDDDIFGQRARRTGRFSSKECTCRLRTTIHARSPRNSTDIRKTAVDLAPSYTRAYVRDSLTTNYGRERTRSDGNILEPMRVEQ